MKSVVLTPYCPWPTDTGAKIEMLKHLLILKELGECQIASATSRPVGTGWNQSTLATAQLLGYEVFLRENWQRRLSANGLCGMLYAIVCKGLQLERAFGHANPYHRYAFPLLWWQELTKNAQLAVINYSYWARLPTNIPKVIILHDLLSDIMWGGDRCETEELRQADLVVAISKKEEEKLRTRGVMNVIWSPPLVDPYETDMNNHVGIVGSGNIFNLEGIKWLQQGGTFDDIDLTIYGGLADKVIGKWGRVPSYADIYTPYRECGIILLTTALGTGVQIKAIEALACGRVIIARKGAMRGIPASQEAWIEVETAAEMREQLDRYKKDDRMCVEQGEQARHYYDTYLDSQTISANLRSAYTKLLQTGK